MDVLRYVLNNNLINFNCLILEFGVFKAQTIDLISCYTENNIYGFDSFEGFKNTSTDQHEKLWYHGRKDNFNLNGNIPQYTNRLDKYERKEIGEVKLKDNVKLIKGYFQDTLNDFLIENNKPISFIHIDSDTYTSCIYILETCLKYIMNDCIIIFDEFINFPWCEEGEYKAFQEWINKYDIEFEWIGVEKDIIKTTRDTDINEYFISSHYNFIKELRKKKIGISISVKIIINNYFEK